MDWKYLYYDDVATYYSFLCGNILNANASFWCDIELIANNQTNRDHIEKDIMDIFLKPNNLRVRCYQFRDVGLPTRLIAEPSHITYRSQLDENEEYYLDSLNGTYMTQPSYVWKYRSHFVAMSSLLLCPFVEIYPPNFRIYNDSDNPTTLEIVEITFSDQTFLTSEAEVIRKMALSNQSQTLSVCKEVLEENFTPDVWELSPRVGMDVERSIIKGKLFIALHYFYKKNNIIIMENLYLVR